MSSRTIITITCDWCEQVQAPETFATFTTTIKVNGDPPRQIDVCDEHAEILDTIRAILRGRGARPDPEVAAGVLRCEICGQPCKGGAGLSAHTRARHG